MKYIQVFHLDLFSLCRGVYNVTRWMHWWWKTFIHGKSPLCLLSTCWWVLCLIWGLGWGKLSVSTMLSKIFEQSSSNILVRELWQQVQSAFLHSKPRHQTVNIKTKFSQSQMTKVGNNIFWFWVWLAGIRHYESSFSGSCFFLTTPLAQVCQHFVMGVSSSLCFSMVGK